MIERNCGGGPVSELNGKPISIGAARSGGLDGEHFGRQVKLGKSAVSRLVWLGLILDAFSGHEMGTIQLEGHFILNIPWYGEGCRTGEMGNGGRNRESRPVSRTIRPGCPKPASLPP